MLNLRQVDLDSESSQADGYSTAQRSTLRFIGNMGESLQFGARSEDDELQDKAHQSQNTAVPLSDLSTSSDTGSIRFFDAANTMTVADVSEHGIF